MPLTSFVNPRKKEKGGKEGEENRSLCTPFLGKKREKKEREKKREGVPLADSRV